MSFSYTKTNMPANELIQDLVRDDLHMPGLVRGQIMFAAVQLQRRFGVEVPVNVNAYGHIFNGEEGNYDVTTANITVQRGVANEKLDDND